ncbi:GTSE1 protein, partial [Psilopogon haemacephalus]|nr:GTSE1 protein [Psilopogon haemacephalus]
SGNEDEVFVGPLGHKEKCIAAKIEANESVEKSIPTSDELMWSPLKGEKFVEIFKEAHLLALRIETESKNKQTKIHQPEEKFVEDSKSKLNILRNQNIEKSPRAVKRETYCVQDSLACQLPACFQKESDKLLSDDKTSALHTPPNRSPVKMCLSSTKIASSPLTEEQKTKERNTKATCKLPMAKPLSSLGKSNLLITEKVKPGKHSSISIKRDLNSMGSSEDLISDKSSAASDVFESSFSGSFLLQDKKVHNASSKVMLKLPGVASGLTRKMTTSSLSVSSMNSSLNSSLLISPIRKNGKSSMSSKSSVSGSKLSSSTNRLAKVSSLQAVKTEKSKSQARSASTHKIPSAASLANSSASATSVAVDSGIQRLSSVPDLQKLCQQNKDGSGMKGSLCPKPRARILSVPTCQTKVSMKTGGKHLLCMTYLKLLAKADSIFSAMAVSTPVKAAEDGIFQNSGFPKRSVSVTPASLKRSGLPTPVRRISGFPAVTPKTAPRMAFSPYVGSICPISNFSTKKTLAAGCKQTNQSKTQVTSSEDDISPPPALPLALNFSPERTATEVVENKLNEDEVQNQLTEDKQTEEKNIGEEKSLPHTLECESRPLIDLSNTPELSKIAPLKPILSEQIKLIDLSSPLITLSPDVNKENLDSPLLKF